MQIGELSERTGTPTKTLRYWEEIGLLPEPSRGPNGYRDYEPSAIRVVGFIRAAKAAGFRLEEIGQILRIRNGGNTPCAHVTSLLHHHLTEVNARIDELELVRAALMERVRVATDFDATSCTDDAICSLIW